MQDYLGSRRELVERLGVDPARGLSPEGVERSRELHGANELDKAKPESLLRRIWEASTEPMLVMLIAAGLIALAVNVFRGVTGGEADYLECVGIFVAIALSVAISVVMEGRSAKAFEALSSMSNDIEVRAVRDGQVCLIDSTELVVGDIVMLSTGDKVPADGRLLESTDFSVDESMLTGESLAAKKSADTVICDARTPLAERENMVYSGTFVVSGHATFVVCAVGNDTEFGAIARELSGIDKSTTPLQEKLAHLGKVITVFGVTAAAVVFVAQVIGFAQSGGLDVQEVLEAFVTSIVLIVAAVPEGLPTIVAVSLSINIIKLSKQRALVRKMIASETIGCINVICSDKTGTLTENKMDVVRYYDDRWHTDPADMVSAEWAHNICLNTTADLAADGGFIGNPTECALLAFYDRTGRRAQEGQGYQAERADHEVVQAFPFSSELKHMTTVSKVDGSVVAYIKGSPEFVLAACDLESGRRAAIEAAMTEAQNDAARVIAFAHKPVDEVRDFSDDVCHMALESDMVFDGFVAIADPLRPDVKQAVEECRGAGIALKILTGDNIVTASAIARELGLLEDGGIAVEARDIEDLSDAELLAMLPDIRVIARSTPTVKMRVVTLLKGDGNVVAVTGDGINDAPALKNADVGVAMGISGTEVSKEASDIVLLDDSFSTIVRAVEWGRNIYENFKRFISFQLTVNLASVTVVIVSILMGLPAPFTALELLWINIIMDGPPALTLGLEPNHSDLMKARPVRRDEAILSRATLARIAAVGLYMSAVFLAQYRLNFLGATEAQQHTVLFTLFVMFQLFNAFNCRELHDQSIFKHLLSNRLMLVVVGCTFLIQVCIIQFAGAVFGTVALPLVMWGKIVATAFTVVVASELVKLVVRAVRRARG